jgi:hypothetical protein
MRGRFVISFLFIVEMLNGVGASYDFTPYNSQTVRAWFISASSGTSGQATVEVSDL